MNYLSRSGVEGNMLDEISEPKRRLIFALRRPAPRAAPAFTLPKGNAACPVETERRRKAYTELIAAQETYLLRAALRLCRGHRENAQDLTQETLIRGYEAFIEGRFAEGSNARAWFMRILTNLYLNETRRDKWNAEIDIEKLLTEQTASRENLQAAAADRPDAALLGRALDEPLEKALNALTEELRLCATLVDMEEFTYAEAAVILDIPVGTVRSRLWRARHLLHELLRDYAQERRML